jgi:TatD DNase family protein
MASLIDLHTHNQTVENDVLKLVNIALNDPKDLPKLHYVGWRSVGLHPWYLNEETIEEDFENLLKESENQKVMMIGECGLDRNIPVDFNFQKEVFIRQIELAENLQKPVIIHCVRAFPEVIALKKHLKPTVPMVIHGFNNHPQICQQLLDNQFYISLGAALSKSTSNATKVIPMIPKEKLFLETDDKNCTISSIFALASTYLDVRIEILQELIKHNFNRVFSNQDLTA